MTWPLIYPAAEFAVYEQLSYNNTFGIHDAKARLANNGRYDQAKDLFLRTRASGSHLESPKGDKRERIDRRGRRGKNPEDYENATADPSLS